MRSLLLSSVVVVTWSHAGLVRLFVDRPSLVARLLQLAGLPAPRGAPRTDDADLSDLAPAQLHCDAVVRFGEPLQLAAVVEIQLAIDAAKLQSWPAYLANLRLRLGCRCVLLVVTPDPAVARWARRPIELGPGFVLHPTVIGPDDVPRVTSVGQASEQLELAVLSALAHPDREVVTAALAATLLSDNPRHSVYADVLLGSLEVARQLLEEMMRADKYEFVSDFARKYVAIGREEGLEQGREQGLEQGREEGRDLGAAQALLTVLEARGIGWSAADEARIAEADAETLRGWIARAANAQDVAEVFGD